MEWAPLVLTAASLLAVLYVLWLVVEDLGVRAAAERQREHMWRERVRRRRQRSSVHKRQLGGE
jgi:hypothetical protein